MKKTKCSLCAAGSKVEDVAGVLTHVVENMTEDGKAALVVCADSPVKPEGHQVAPRCR
jgi:hypothetical protein